MATSLDAMSGLAGDGTTPDITDMLAQLGQDDPRMAALCRFFMQRQADAAQAGAAHADTALAPETQAPPEDDVRAELEARLARLRRIADAMHRDLRVLRGRNAMAAAALGACEDCWGGDASCAQCGGRGRPGSDAPDPALYARLVVPAARRLIRDEHAPIPQLDRDVGDSAVGALD